MKVTDVAKLFGITGNTIKNWIAEFEMYFSEPAKKMHSSQRIINDEDLVILATINYLRSEGLDYAAVSQRLSDGFRVDPTNTRNYTSDSHMVPTPAVEQIIDATEIRRELETVKAERDYLQVRISELQVRAQKLEAERETHSTEIKALKDEIAELRERVGRAEGELHYRRFLDEQNSKKSDS